MCRKIMLLCILSLMALGCGSQNEPLARIASVKGKVDARLEASSTFVAAQTDMQLMHQGAVRTAKESGATLEDVVRKGAIEIDPDSYYEVRSGTSIGFQRVGKAVFDINRQQTEIHIDTPHGTTAVLGTRFGQIVSSDTFELWVEEGQVEFTASNGDKQKVSANQKLQWQVNEGSLPQPVNFNLLESEDFFGAKGENFKFNQR